MRCVAIKRKAYDALQELGSIGGGRVRRNLGRFLRIPECGKGK